MSIHFFFRLHPSWSARSEKGAGEPLGRKKARAVERAPASVERGTLYASGAALSAGPLLERRTRERRARAHLGPERGSVSVGFQLDTAKDGSLKNPPHAKRTIATLTFVLKFRISAWNCMVCGLQEPGVPR